MVRTEAQAATTPDVNTVVLTLPGMTLNGTIMPAFVQEHLSVDFCQFVPPGPDRDISMDTYVHRLEATLAEEPLWHRPRRVIVGHSFGGMLALYWLLKTEGAVPVDGVVLVAASAGPMFDVVRLRLGRVGEREWRAPLKPWMPLWNLVTVTRAAKALLSPSHSEEGHVDFRALAKQSDAAVDRAGWRNTNWRSMRAFRLALDGFDCRDRLAKFPARAIVLHGDRDSLFPTSVAEDLATRLPSADLRLIRGAGHILPLTHGEHVVRAVNELLEG